MPKICLNFNVNINNHNFIRSLYKSVYYCNKEWQTNSLQKPKVLLYIICKRHDRNKFQDKPYLTNISPK